MKKVYLTFILLSVMAFCKGQSCLSICDSNLLSGPFPFDDNIVSGYVNYGLPGGIANPHFHDVDYNTGLLCTSTKTNFYKDCEMEHNLDPNGTTPYLSDFGTGVSNHADVIQYITSRGAIFFGDIIGGVAGSLNKKIFIECKKKRIKCNTANNFDNTCCDGCITSNAGDEADNKCNTKQTQLP